MMVLFTKQLLASKMILVQHRSHLFYQMVKQRNIILTMQVKVMRILVTLMEMKKHQSSKTLLDLKMNHQKPGRYCCSLLRQERVWCYTRLAFINLPNLTYFFFTFKARKKAIKEQQAENRKTKIKKHVKKRKEKITKK